MSRSRISEVRSALPSLVRANFKKKFSFEVRPSFGIAGGWKVRTKYDSRASWHSVVVRHGTTDWSVFRAIFIENVYRLDRTVRGTELRDRYQAIVASGRTPLVVDAGANVGFASLWFGAYFPDAIIIALEPDAGNLALAQSNCTLPNVIFFRAGLADEPGRLRLIDPGLGDDAFRTEASSNLEDTVPAMTMHDVIALAEGVRPGSEPFLAKIDIEGYEKVLFSRNTDWVDRFSALIIELHDWMLPGQATAAPLLHCVAEYGRDFTWHGENAWSVRNP